MWPFFFHPGRWCSDCGRTTVGKCTRSKPLELHHPCHDIVNMDLDRQRALSQTYAQFRSWQSLEPFTISVAFRKKCLSLSWTPESFLCCMNYQYTLETNIFKWSFAFNWSSGIKTEFSPHYSEIGAIFRIPSGTTISHSQDPEPEFKGYLMSVTLVCQRAHYVGIHMILHIFRLKNEIKKEEQYKCLNETCIIA